MSERVRPVSTAAGRWRRSIRGAPALVIVAVAIAAAACAPERREDQRLRSFQAVDPAANPDALRFRLQELTEQAAGNIELAADAIRARSDDPRVRRNALLWKLHGIPACLNAGFREAPLAALVDSWALYAQQLRYFSDGAGRGLFGDQQEIAVSLVKELERDVRAVAETVVAEGAMESATASIEAWVEEHPIESALLGRPSMFGEYADRALPAAGVFGGIESMESQVRNLTVRARTFFHLLPRYAVWTAELYADELFAEHSAQELLGGVVAAVADLDRMADVAARVPPVIEDAREALVAAIQSERVALVEAVDRQRLETIEAIRDERRELLVAVVRESERSLAELESLMTRLVAASRPDAEAVVDHLVRRLIVLLAVGIPVCAVLAWLVLRLVTKRLEAPRA